LRELLLRELPERAADIRAVRGDANLRVEGIMDSLIFVIVIDFLEQTFDLRVPPDDLVGDRFASLEAIARYVTLHAPQGAQRGD
jgi:acyl carrier protein